jgi:hypothetical protein
LLPTHGDNATSQAFRICPSQLEGYRIRFEDGSSKTIVAEELSQYGSQDFAEKGDIPPLEQIIRWIEVDVPARHIPPNVRLIDTPGLGSLYATHGQITRRFIPHAHAVIFVLESQAPISQPELDILEEVLAHTQHVFFVQTKIDQFRKDEWQGIRRRNEAILRERFGNRLTYVRVWPLSSVNLQKAVDTGDPDYEVVSRGKETIRALEEFLFYECGWSRMELARLLTLDYHKQGHDLLNYRLHTLEEGEKKLLEAREELVARRDQLKKDWGQKGQKRQELARKLDVGIDTAKNQLADALDELQADWEQKISTATSLESLKHLVESLRKEISEQVDKAWNQVSNNYRNNALEMARQFSDDLRKSELVPPSCRPPKTGALINQGVVDVGSSFEDIIGVVSTGLPYVATGIGALLVSSIPLLGTVLGPLLLPIGVIVTLFGAWRIYDEHRRGKQKEFQTNKDRLLEELDRFFRQMRNNLLSKRLETGLESPLHRALREVRDRLLEEIDACVGRRLCEMDEEISRLDEDSKLELSDRKEKIKQLKVQLEEWKMAASRLDKIGSALAQLKKERD